MIKRVDFEPHLSHNENHCFEQKTSERRVEKRKWTFYLKELAEYKLHIWS